MRVILGIFVLFAVPFMLLGHLATENARLRDQLRAEQEANALLLQQNRVCQVNLEEVRKLWDQEREARLQAEQELEILDQIREQLDQERAARLRMEQELRAAQDQLARFANGPTPNGSNNTLALMKLEAEWWHVLLALSLLAMMVIGGLSVHHYSKVSDEPQGNRAGRDIVSVRMTRQQCRAYSRWQRNRSGFRDQM
jgi:hypothetical protein